MPEIRRNLITRDWVIIATERAKRPHELLTPKLSKTVLQPYSAHCPFCAGNEERTPIECGRISDGNGWKVRSVPNKFPALVSEGEPIMTIQGMYRSVEGVGIHEVLIEHPRHDLTTALLPIEDVANIILLYRQRYQEIRKDRRIRAIIIFKNHGEKAGTSLEHPHSQIAATPIVPTQIRIRIEEAIRFFDDTGECLFCQTLREELATNKRIILKSDHFVAFIPYAALSPFHIWIFPLRHTSSFDEITDAEVVDLALTLKTVLAKLYYGLNNPDYNYSIRSLPTDSFAKDYFHWYLAVIPRLGITAGFELGSGMYINPSLPEESAKYLSELQIPD